MCYIFVFEKQMKLIFDYYFYYNFLLYIFWRFI